MPSTPTRVLAVVLCFALPGLSAWAAPLKVLVASDSESFRTAYAEALKASGALVVTSARPEENALAKADAVLLHSGTFTALPPASLAALTAFAQRGGGVVAVNGAVASGDVAWGQANLGGAWNGTESRKFMSKMMFTIRQNSHPIVEGAATFDLDDDTFYDLSLHKDVFVLASAFTPKVTRENRKTEANRASIYDIQPQMWSFEDPQHRAVVLLQGAEASWKHPSCRTFLLRGLAWTAHRENVNELASKADLAVLRYPAGGPLSPLEAVKRFQLQPGLTATVVAAEPMINKPIAVQWDARGRLWVAETVEYPNGRRPLNAEAWKEGGVLDPDHYDRPARDRISILEDTNGDGVMDKKTVFHEGLELITGFCLHEDGAIVVSHPNITFLRDTDGDDKADKEVPLYGGFTPGDTHFVANHFITAPDGWIYASDGSGANATNPTTREVLGKVSSGVFRFKADGSAIQQVASQGGNTFGAEVTSDMEIYHGKATNGNPIQHVVLPEWILAKAPGNKAQSMQSVNPGRQVFRTDLPDRAALMQIDQVGRYTAACSTMVYEGGAFPGLEGMCFVTEPILDIVHFEKLIPNGSSFKGELVLDNKEWIRSTDYWFCPIDVTFGPDGAIYLLDFYTPVVAHNDTRGPQHSKSGASVRPDREHYFGRIYRIQNNTAPKFTVPDLTKADAAGLVAAFSHPNRVVRFNAHRLLLEKQATLGAAAVPALGALLAGENNNSSARILALWALQRMNKLTPEQFAASARSKDAALRKNTYLAAESGRLPLNGALVKAALADTEPRVRLAALRALSVAPIDAEAGTALLAAQPTFTDPWTQAAASAAANANPSAQLFALLSDKSANDRVDFARSLASSLVEKADAASITPLLAKAAASPSSVLAAAVVREFGLNPPAAPADPAKAHEALRSLLASPDRTLAAAALPLAAAWDKSGSLASAKAAVIKELAALASNATQPAPARLQAVRDLLSARASDPAILPAVLALLKLPQQTDAFRRDLISALSATGDNAVGQALADAFPGLSTAARDAAFDALTSRPAWAALLLNGLEAKKFAPTVLGTMQVSRLNAHPDAATSARAKKLLAELGGGTNPAKDEIIAKLLPAVEKPGDAAKGKELFTATCSVCHRLGGTGNEYGPGLDGIGSHPAAELLTHIVDPNRMVDDEHRTWNLTLKDGSQQSALIESENDAIVKLKLPGGGHLDLKTADIVKREKAANSLMPEGFENLGPDTLRDIITYIRATAPKSTSDIFRPLDLKGAFTADGRRGIYADIDAADDTLPFLKFGAVKANGVVYDIVNPKDAPGGKNLIVLKGGPGKSLARSFPQRVEIPVGYPVFRLHFLGGVAGWGGRAGSKTPAMKVTLVFEDGSNKVVQLYAGQEFVDYIGRIDVPGSVFADGIVSDHQIRTFALPVGLEKALARIVLESEGNNIAATTAAITAETSDSGLVLATAPAPAPAPVSPLLKQLDPNNPQTTAATGQKFAEPKAAGSLRVLLAGAGSSHDFPKFFLGADSTLLRAKGGLDTAATPNLEEALALLPQADVLIFSGNHPQYGSDAFQKALNAFADAGHGVIILHAGTWKNYPPKTGYNQRFVGGGATSHGFSDFTVTVKEAGHPVMARVPATFTITDESYHADVPAGPGVEILAQNGLGKGTDKPYPSVWVVKDPKARIVCVTLGHAAAAHDNPAYQTLMTNAVNWVARR